MLVRTSSKAYRSKRKANLTASLSGYAKATVVRIHVRK